MTKTDFLCQLQEKNMMEIRDLSDHSVKLMVYLNNRLPDIVSDRFARNYLVDSALLGKLRPPKVTGLAMTQHLNAIEGRDEG